MPVIGSHSSKAVGYTIGDIFILDACNLALETGYSRADLSTIHVKGKGSHPSMPPLPVAKVRPVHCSGSHSSRVMLDRFDVGTDKAIRHKSTETTCEPRLHVASLSGNVRLVPAGTYWSCVLVEFQILASGTKERHVDSKV